MGEKLCEMYECILQKDLSTPIPGDFFSGGALGWGREGVVHLMLFPLGQAGTYMMQLLS